MKNLILVTVLAFGIYVHTLYSQNADAQGALEKVDRRFFIENKGQWHSDVLYLCRMGGLDAWITKYGMNYTFYKIEKDKTAEFARAAMPKGKFDHDELENSILLGHRVLFELENHNPSPSREGKKQMEGYYNYFIGNDPSKHATYVGLYKEAVIKNVYNGIDLRYYFDRGSLRYDFVVQPYADPSQIQFKLRGQNKAYTKGESKLCFTTRFGEVELADLKTYQENKIIQSKFLKQGEVWTFALGEYDRTKPLVIDPLVYSTYLGGSSTDEGYGIAVDGSGQAYVTGRTYSTNYDVTAGAFQTTYGGGTTDVFVTKLDLSMSTSMDNNVFSQNQSFALYPNPAQNSVVIENFTATAQEYELTDISGKILQIYTLPQGKNSIQLNLPKGMYFVRERKHSYTQKLLVE